LAKSLRNAGYEPKFYDDVIHIEKPRDLEDSNSTNADIFLFHYGCLVIWGLEEEEELQILSLVEHNERKKLTEYYKDTSFYSFHEASEDLQTEINEEDDEIYLESDDVLIRLSLSHALSQSVKLSVFESSIAKTIESVRHLPDELALNGKISLSSTKLSRKIGALFAQRHSMNLHSDILDTPEFFWRRPKYEPYYHMAANYLDIQARLEILNRRLDVIHELYDILSNELKHIHSSRLELVIIILIMIEVLFNMIRDYSYLKEFVLSLFSFF
jgi:uncharacterized Rmd1/YagE family protein